MLIQNSQLFLLTLSAIPIYTIIILMFVPTFNKMNNEVMHANSKVSSAIIDDINGIETIKSLNSEEIRFQLIEDEVTKYLNKSFRLNTLESLQNTLKQASQLILTVGILWIGAKLVMKNQISVGQLITYNTLLFYFINPLENIINLQIKLQSASVANTRLNDIYLVESEHNAIIPTSKNNPAIDDIVFNNVSYQYGFRKNTLDHINLTIRAGEKICFVGASGSGKSTLAKHFVNFYSPTQGEILLNGTNIEEIDKKQLRAYINCLPQEAYIFNGSILENLTLGTINKVNEQDIISACQTAEILSDIEKMPLGFQTEVNDGSGLSGGQKQRLALARALLAETPVLILDEATSGLDILTEKKIVDNLLSLQGKTIIFIAHRLSIAKQCDKIYVIDNGHIAEKGTHDELMTKNGIYSQLVNG
ncbi:ABC-type bacteriocin transporter [Streptococcus gallolyticus]|uniref:ABC-type bacteriocin transporter n=1 Tax=Streptococcus gallolyticus TaxID=315405 RepID=A0A1H9V006_9STRE|nr:ABC-type bacteriocin transporter [Streptococcus gallolyticus]